MKEGVKAVMNDGVKAIWTAEEKPERTMLVDALQLAMTTLGAQAERVAALEKRVTGLEKDITRLELAEQSRMAALLAMEELGI